VKTASVHVSHILQKLGTSNRTQAAAIARTREAGGAGASSGAGASGAR
jgi:DNA-binding NarL/FixJ family response regulator